jgi:hypothetical protein
VPEPNLDPELKALEQALGTLEPQAQLSRETVLFRAGQASMRGRWLWPVSTIMSTAAALVLGVLLWRHPAPSADQPPPRIVIVEKIVPAPVEQTPTAVPERGPELLISTPTQDSDSRDYLRLRQEVMRWGVDVLYPAPPQKMTGQPLTPSAAPRLAEGPGGGSRF